ncbi:MAG: hypothetical protein LBO66_12910 [Deltaproteobacteria bacterium]|jgi:hypothetical protein|nr:hypothetical protein [Deltaproteobacteria bacterium]
MRFILRLAFLALCPLLAVSCGDSKLDVSTSEAFVASVQKMHDDVSGAEREDFERFFFIAMNGRSDLITLSVLSEPEIPKLDSYYNVLVSRRGQAEMGALNGLSAAEIVELGRNLKMAYLDNRVKEITLEMDALSELAQYYAAYAAELEKVTISFREEAAFELGADGRVSLAVAEINVINGSSRPLVDIQKATHGSPWSMVLIYGGQRDGIYIDSARLLGADGLSAFAGQGSIPAGSEAKLTIRADVSDRNWVPKEGARVLVSFPDGFVACLEGWEKFFEAEDAHKRLQELDRQVARFQSQARAIQKS